MTLERIFAAAICCLAGWAVLTVAADDEAPKPLTAVEARSQVGKEIVVETTIQTAKNRLENRGEIYLDAELDFRDPKNFAIVINRTGAAAFKEKGIDDPAEHFMGKTIRTKGVVTVVDEVPRIEVSEVKQIELVEKQ